ncbi:hypothetical protein D7B24_001330 [Verticillium nonalfalfae]|uniref:Integral membrane protein n=1 Tax=Verticillium nonalfalfae TaxID=1051616 RepID=A0A3M9XZW0_9PEZI|nr:uncharacterized protein D7B24_001330 [Verticillium nonalfalfae]RNJ53807.1 hypothetical protein D7B24_001330 [Verticillium nonalfalfae]
MSSPITSLIILILSSIITPALTHDNCHDATTMSDGSSHTEALPPSYFNLADHAAAMYAHITLMVIAWVLVLPLAVMLSLARSRYTLALQSVFLAFNALGVLVGAVYNAVTPDLYPNNAHHKAGWAFTWIALAQACIGLFGRTTRQFRVRLLAREARSDKAHQAVTSAFFEPVGDNCQHDGPQCSRGCRLSHDRDQGTEPNTGSLSGGSDAGMLAPVSLPLTNQECEDEGQGDLDSADQHPVRFSWNASRNSPRWFRLILNSLLSQAWKSCLVIYDVLDRIILILGFIGLTSGAAVHGRLFEGRAIYGGMAHWVKGGIFFWFGIFTLGRWSGSFGKLGWAWNARTRETQDKWYPSAELVESALIFSYGATNIFLEHLSSTDKTWTPRDLEHVSITNLFIGGGLLGMLVESTRARDLLNTTGTGVAFPAHETTRMDGERTEKEKAAEPPKHYDFSINPVPALVILLLGTTMSSHHQSTMDSTMMHKQWGNLLAGASLARGFTYVLVYLKPPRSILPSRPPTELVTSFCLITGGIIFMASSTDTVKRLRHYNLDAMFVYTVVTGIVGLLMAWVIIVLAVKGAAVRQQRRARSSAWTSNERQYI